MYECTKFGCKLFEKEHDFDYGEEIKSNFH